jgi:hypothetical protein
MLGFLRHPNLHRGFSFRHYLLDTNVCIEIIRGHHPGIQTGHGIRSMTNWIKLKFINWPYNP